MILYLLLFLVSLGACTIGSICGIGGGIIIKPALDAFSKMNVAAVSFLSGCTVLAMTLYSIVSSWIRKQTKVDLKISISLSIGAVFGGIIGKQIFSSIWCTFDDKNVTGSIQAACLIILTIATLIYMLNKDKIHTYRTKKTIVTLAIGFVLGFFSAFLGIGGGPINLVALFYFFSMETKEAAENSLFIILFSQISSLFTTVITDTIPSVDMFLLVLMITGGILGGAIGKNINKRIDARAVEKLFMCLMIIIILISIYNLCKFYI